MNPSDITPLVLVHNEACNLERTLSRLGWAKRVVIVDSGSTDESRAIASRMGNVSWVERPFDNFANQRNFGLSSIESDWVLSLDADFVLGEGFESEIRGLDPASAVSAYEVAFEYVVFGQSIGSSLYPNRPALFRVDRCKYLEDGHCERLEVVGRTETLRSRILHDDRKPLARWFRAQVSYAELEARKLEQAPRSTLGLADKIRKTAILAPMAVPLYALFWKGLVFRGWPAWYYVLQRTIAEMILAVTLVDARLRRP